MTAQHRLSEDLYPGSEDEFLKPYAIKSEIRLPNKAAIEIGATRLNIGVLNRGIDWSCMQYLHWTIWDRTSSTNSLSNSSVKERLYLVVFAPISIAALFGSLNLTFMAYGFKNSSSDPGYRSSDRRLLCRHSRPELQMVN